MWEIQIVNLIESQGFINFIEGYVPATSLSLLMQMLNSLE